MIDRLILVVALAAVVAVVVWGLRRRPPVRRRPVNRSGLPAGVYLLTSDGCDTCDRARSKLIGLGVAHTELSWQKNPAVFERLGIDAVPSVLQIDATGSGTWWRGGVPRRPFRLP
jgi:hypothetical protein